MDLHLGGLIIKILYLDFERGSQTLGSKDKIQEMFGYPMLTMNSWNQFQSMIGQLYTKEKTTNVIKIGTLEIPEETVEVKAKNGTVVDALILDTFSELSKKFQRSLTDKNGKMKLQDWGVLKSKLDTALDFVTSIPGIVICNVHSKIQTMDDGTSKILPYIDVVLKKIYLNGLILCFMQEQCWILMVIDSIYGLLNARKCLITLKIELIYYLQRCLKTIVR